MSQESQHRHYKALLAKMYIVNEFIMSLESPGNLKSTSQPWQLQVNIKEGIRSIGKTIYRSNFDHILIGN